MPASLAAAPALVGKPAEATRRRARQPVSRAAERGARKEKGAKRKAAVSERR